MTFGTKNQFTITPCRCEIRKGESGNPYAIFDLIVGIDSPEYGVLSLTVRNWLAWRTAAGEIFIMPPKSRVSSRRKATYYDGIELSPQAYHHLQALLEKQIGKAFPPWVSKKKREGFDSLEEALKDFERSQN